MGKRFLKYFLTMIILFIGAFCVTTGCSAKQYVVSVNFVSVDGELKSIRSYQRGLEYGESHEITFKVPEGFDTSNLTAMLKVGQRSANLDVDIKYKENLISSYNYATAKDITITVNNVINDCTVEIDMTDVKRKICSLDMSSNTSKFGSFTAVAINPEALEQLVVLDETKVLRTYQQTVNHTLDIKYGDYVALIYRKNHTGPEIETLYSKENYFTESSHKANVGKIHYSFYNKAVKGNSAYNYKNDSDTRIFYLGQIKEKMSFYDSIPDYVESKGFTDIEEIPNTLALLTNMSKYSSDLMKVSLYKKTNQSYNPGNSDMDMISDTSTVIEKVDKVEEVYNRYDLYRIYIGDNYNAETHWSASEKANIIEEAYLCVESCEDLSYFYKHILEFENQSYLDAFTFDFDITGSSGKKYVKLDKKFLETFLLDRSYEDENTSYDFKVGMGIFYLRPTLEFKNLKEDVEVINGATGETTTVSRKKYSTVYLKYFFDTTLSTSIYDYEFAVYAKNGEYINYGMYDFHYKYDSDKFPMVYIRTSDIFNNNNEYKDSLYFDLIGPEVVNFRSPRLHKVDVKNDGNAIGPGDDDIYVQESSGINGFKCVQLSNSEYIKRENGDWVSFEFNILLKKNITTAYNVNFTNVNLPKVSSQGIYVSNSAEFSELTDFKLVNYLSAEKTSDDVVDNTPIVNFGYYRDIYFIVISDVDIPFNIYLDPNNPESKVSTIRPLYDIVGNPLLMQVGEELREVKVMYMDVVYELIDKDGYYRFYAG
ncbi:MAG: hypothetical protein E7354_02750 [Clostridiales bacterium]|nr:hypothetical protein [Clostridiales bacterium]